MHIQTLPSLLLQTCLIYQHHGLINIGAPAAVPIGLAIGQLLMCGVTIALSSLVLSTPSAPSSPAAKCDEENPNPQPLPARNASSGVWNLSSLCQPSAPAADPSESEDGTIPSSSYQLAIATMRSVCLLFSRTVAVGVFMVSAAHLHIFNDSILAVLNALLEMR